MSGLLSNRDARKRLILRVMQLVGKLLPKGCDYYLIVWNRDGMVPECGAGTEGETLPRVLRAAADRVEHARELLRQRGPSTIEEACPPPPNGWMN